MGGAESAEHGAGGTADGFVPLAERETNQDAEPASHDERDGEQRPRRAKDSCNQNPDCNADSGGHTDPVPAPHDPQCRDGHSLNGRSTGEETYRIPRGQETIVPDEAKPLLVFFSSQRSGPARRMESLLAHFARKERDRLRVMRIDIDQQPDVATRFKVADVPTLVLVKGKRVVDRIDGRASAPKIESMLEQHLPVVAGI